MVLIIDGVEGGSVSSGLSSGIILVFICSSSILSSNKYNINKL